MASLFTRFPETLDRRGIGSESYNKQHLKSRIEKHFGDDVVFSQPSHRSKPEIVYSSAIKVQDVLHAWADNTPVPENKGKGSETATDEDIFSSCKLCQKRDQRMYWYFHETARCKGH